MHSDVQILNFKNKHTSRNLNIYFISFCFRLNKMSREVNPFWKLSDALSFPSLLKTDFYVFVSPAKNFYKQLFAKRIIQYFVHNCPVALAFIKACCEITLLNL